MIFHGFILTLFPNLNLPGLVRVSLGIGNSEEDVDTLIHVLGKIAGKHQAKADRHLNSSNKETPILTKADLKQQINDFTRSVAKRVYT